jgi:hypothetical protein
MNFRAALEKLIQFFSKEEMDFALIGAFALNAYGYVRATQDIDFLVRARDQDKIIRFLETLGYETLHRSKGFSNHLHRLGNLGRIDFVYVEGKTADSIYASTNPLLILDGFPVPVAKPEHLIALKAFAMKNDPTRSFREMADIHFLLTLGGIDKGEIRSYFQKYGLLEKYDELTGGE